MIITSVSIRNFRCLYDVSVDFEPLVALLGRNGTGKSSVLRALEVFYNTSYPITEEDFFNRNCEDEIEIRITYGHLRDDELFEFGSYVTDGNLIVTKRISMYGGAFSQKYYSAFPQFPRFSEIRSISAALEKRAAWAEFVDASEFPGLERARSAAEVEGKMTEFETEHPELLEPIEREEQFFGPPNIGGGKLDNYTKFLLIPAVKDVTEEFLDRRGSSLYQLLDLIVHRRIESRKDILEKRVEIENLVKALFDPENLPELQEVGNEISQLLDSFFPGAGLVLDWDEIQVPKIPLPTARSRLVEDDFEGDIDKKGHGLQRALLITLLQYLAQIPKAASEETSVEGQNGSVQGTTDDETSPNSEAPSLILAIEEPELYLHPLRCKYLSSLFLELTGSADGSPPMNQVVFSSHSPHFVDLARFETIRIFRKIRVPQLQVAATSASSFAIDAAIQRLTQIAQLDPENVTAESFKSRILPIMSSIVNEGFFADLVVIVEGFGDAGIMMELQEVLEMNWLSLGIAVIPIEGKTKLDRPMIIFQGLGIPVYLIFDGDKQNQGGKNENSSIQTNRSLMRLIGTTEEDFPVSQVQPGWAVFEGTIESEMRAALGDEVFESIRKEISDELSISREAQITKNIHCASRFIEEIYSQGHAIPILEEIVNAITDLSVGNTA